MKCSKCGAENPEDANFCIECSLKLKQVCNCWVKGKGWDFHFPGGRKGMQEKRFLDQVKTWSKEEAADM